MEKIKIKQKEFDSIYEIEKETIEEPQVSEESEPEFLTEEEQVFDTAMHEEDKKE